MGERLESLTLSIIEGIYLANSLTAESKKSRLGLVNAELSLLKLMVRLAMEIKCLSQKQYLTLQADLQEVGRMLGGWIRSLS